MFLNPSFVLRHARCFHKYYSEKSTFFERVAHLQFAVQSALIDQSAVQFKLENGSEKVVSLAFENILSVAVAAH